VSKQIDFDHILDQPWRNIDKKDVALLDALESYDEDQNFIIHIGTDAQTAGHGVADFVVCVCVHVVGKGGRVFYLRHSNISVNNLWEKLYNETMLSLSVAMALTEANSTFKDRILVHVDANPDTRYASSDHVQALAGMVVGYGFKHVLKPDSWASSHCADHIVKHKNK